MDIRFGDHFRIDTAKMGYISDISACGFHYHTLDRTGKCIKGQTYIKNEDFKKLDTDILRGRVWPFRN